MFESPYFVGREAEIADVQVRLHDAALGTGSGIVFAGETGVGKSRFLRACAALKSSVGTVSIYCGTAVPGRDAGSQLAQALRLTSGAGSSPSAASLLAAVAVRSKRKPIAVFLDDVHLASSGELRLANALLAMASARHYRIVVVATVDERRRTRGFKAEVHRLAPLDDTAMEILLRSVAQAGSRTFAGDEMHELLATAQGNPRFGIELIECLATRSASDGPRVPPSARVAVEAARETLSRSDFDIVCACSVVGQRFHHDWIPYVTQRPRAAVADALQNACDLGLLEEQTGAPGWVSFRRVAIRQALRTSLVAFKRRIFHERAAERLSTAPDDDEKRYDYYETLAEHWEVLDERERAAESFARAADELLGASRFAAAAESYARASAHLPPGSAEWLRIQLHIVRCYTNCADWARMIPVLRTALSFVDRRADAATADNLLSNLFLAHLNDGDQDAAECVAREIATLDLPATPAHAQVATLILAYALCYNGRPDEAAALLQTIDYERLADGEARLRYLITRAEIDALREPLERSLELIDEAAEIAGGIGLRGTALCYSAGVEIASRYGDLTKAREYITRTDAVASRTAGEVNDRKRSVVKDRIRTAVLAGDVRAAGELLRANLNWRASGRHNEAFDAGYGVSIGMRAGDLALVDAFFEPTLLLASVAARDAESCGHLLPGFADVMQIRGQSKELRSILERCIDERLIDAYAAIQLAATRYAPIDCAERALAQTQEYFAGAVAPAAGAHVALCKAMVASRQGRQGTASEFARDAAAQFERMGWRLYEAVARELAGDVRGAARLYERCGAIADVARLAASQTRKLKRSPFGARLTPRELEVARLVMRKRSNQQIARALEISVRTVDHHVEAAFSKLGVRARWQLTAELLGDSGAAPAPGLQPAT